MAKQGEPGSQIPAASFATERAVLLPCEPEHFREFISSLLGQPQTIERTLPGPFDVERKDVENIHHLLLQRISAQNDATLMSFTAKIVYFDDSSVALDSLNDFLSYAEVKPLLSTALHITWTFLVHFPTSKVPEKQQIQLSFFSGSSRIPDIIETPYTRRIRFRELPGTISLRISHTDRTWGADLDALLTGHLKLLRKKESPLRVWISDQAGWFGFAAGFLLVVLSVVGSLFVGSRLSNKYEAALQAVRHAKDLPTVKLEKTISIVAEIVGTGVWTKYAFSVSAFTVLSVIAAIVVGMIVGGSLDMRRPSFVLLTPNAFHQRDEVADKLNNNIWVLLFSAAGTLLFGVVSNYAFYLISNAFLK